MNEIEKTVWELHDRRLNEHEIRFNDNTRDFTEVKETVKTILNRINEGLSVTNQKILTKQGEIELKLHDLSHNIEMQSIKTNEKINAVHEQLVARIEPLEGAEEKHESRSDRLWWAIVGGFIALIIVITGSRLADRWWPKDKVDQPLAAFPIKDRR